MKQIQRFKKLVALLVAAGVLALVPRFWCGREAAGLLDGSAPALKRLTLQVRDRVNAVVTTADFNTGSAFYDGEWVFGSYQMAGLGMAQMALADPKLRDSLLPAVEQCIDGMVSKAGRAFDIKAWGSDPLATLGTRQDHAAYLGYLNLVLGMHRQLAPKSRFTRLHERISGALIRRLRRSKSGLLATYPGIGFPVDTAAVAGSIALYDRATGRDHGALIHRWADTTRRRYVHRKSGMLIQAARPSNGKWLDRPRASGTALGAYFAAFAHRGLSRQLLTALKTSASSSFLGFGLVREYPDSVPRGKGDIDSGPMLFGISFSGTGFALASSRIHGEKEMFSMLYRTAHLVGSPLDRHDKRTYVTGGPLGDAIMLAMLSAGEGVAP